MGYVKNKFDMLTGGKKVEEDAETIDVTDAELFAAWTEGEKVAGEDNAVDAADLVEPTDPKEDSGEDNGKDEDGIDSGEDNKIDEGLDQIDQESQEKESEAEAANSGETIKDENQDDETTTDLDDKEATTGDDRSSASDGALEAGTTNSGEISVEGGENNGADPAEDATAVVTDNGDKSKEVVEVKPKESKKVIEEFSPFEVGACLPENTFKALLKKLGVSDAEFKKAFKELNAEEFTEIETSVGIALGIDGARSAKSDVPNKKTMLTTLYKSHYKAMGKAGLNPIKVALQLTNIEKRRNKNRPKDFKFSASMVGELMREAGVWPPKKDAK